MEINRRWFIASLGGPAAVALMSSEQKASALEAYMIEKLNEEVESVQSGAAPKYPTVAEIEAQNARRTGVRRGAGSVFNATGAGGAPRGLLDRKSTRLNSSHI